MVVVKAVDFTWCHRRETTRQAGGNGDVGSGGGAVVTLWRAGGVGVNGGGGN